MVHNPFSALLPIPSLCPGFNPLPLNAFPLNMHKSILLTQVRNKEMSHELPMQ